MKARSPRIRTYKGGSILIGTLPPVECLVRNLSETGACLEVQGHIRPPETFTLIIRPELLRRTCAVAWRDPPRVGVHFK